MECRYWEDKLSQGETLAYHNIVEAIQNRETSAKYPPNVVLRKVMQCVYDDYPKFFYVSHGFEYQQSLFGAKAIIKYLYSESEIRQIQNQIDAEVNRFLRTKISKKMTEYEKEQAVYEYLTEEVAYDFESAMSNQLRGYEDSHTIVGVFINKKAVCDGFSSAFKYLCDVLSIPCIIVSGEGRSKQISGPHAWNMVELGGGFQHVDVTWDNYAMSGCQFHSYSLLNLNDKEMRKEHVWDEKIYPACREASMNYYRLNEAIVGTRQSMLRYVKEQLQNMEDIIRIRIDESGREADALYGDIGTIVREAMKQSRNTRVRGIETQFIDSHKIIILKVCYE